MSRRSRRQPLSWHLVRLPIWLILVVGVAASAWYAEARRQEVLDRSSSEFASRSESQAARLSTALRRNVDLASSVSGFVSASRSVDNASMATWFQAVGAERYPGLSAVGFVERVAAADLPAFVTVVTDDPVPLTTAEPFTLLPAGDRTEYCLVRAGVGGEGTSLHDVPPGLDLCALPELGDALRRSAATGELVQLPQFNGPTEAIDAGDTAARLGLSRADQARLNGIMVEGTSIVVIRPVYGGSGPLDAPEARISRHLGWAIVAFDARTTLVANLEGSPADFMSLTSRQPVTDPGAAVAAATLGDRPAGRAFTRAVDLDADGPWRVVFETSSAEVSEEAARRGTTALLLGVGGTMVLFSFLTVVVSSRQRAMRLADQRTGELRHLALHDGLTGLPNRALLLDQAERLLASTRRDGRVPAALFLDLDGFKVVNDTLGHAAGDRLLQSVANRLAEAVREGDTVGRIGGDEFVVLTSIDPFGAGPQVVADRLLDVLREPFPPLVGHGRSGELRVTASIGIATGDRPTPDDLLRDADIALYKAKAAGKDRWATFDAEVHEGFAGDGGAEPDRQAPVEARELRLGATPPSSPAASR